ncbi:MAG TPA: helix-turn-helix domain-containing protein [bacterium]|jgi:transposase
MKKKAKIGELLEIRRRQGVAMYKKGFNQYEVAEALGVKQASVSRWIACEAESGEDGLRCKPRTGPEPKLNGEQKNEELPRIKKRLRARLDADFRG